MLYRETTFFGDLLITFLVANIGAFLLLPGAYSFPKNLIEITLRDKQIFRNEANKSNYTNTIVAYYMMFDYITYRTVLYAVFSIINGTLLILNLVEFLNRNITIVVLTAVWIIFFITMKVSGIALGIGRSSSYNLNIAQNMSRILGETFTWGVTLPYHIGIILLIFFRINFELFFLLLCIVFFLFLILWLLPPILYTPLTNLIRSTGSDGREEESNKTSESEEMSNEPSSS